MDYIFRGNSPVAQLDFGFGTACNAGSIFLVVVARWRSAGDSSLRLIPASVLVWVVLYAVQGLEQVSVYGCTRCGADVAIVARDLDQDARRLVGDPF